MSEVIGGIAVIGSVLLGVALMIDAICYNTQQIGPFGRMYQRYLERALPAEMRGMNAAALEASFTEEQLRKVSDVFDWSNRPRVLTVALTSKRAATALEDSR